MHDRFLRQAVLEKISHRILQDVLHRELDIDDVLVVGQHQCFLEHLVAFRTAIADLDRAYACQVDQFVRVDRIRQAPLQARICRFDKLAETQHDTTLACIDDVQAAGQPDDDDQAEHHADATAELARRHGRTAFATAVVRLAAEQPRQALVEIAPQVFQIGRSLIAAFIAIAALIAPAGVIQRHQDRIQHVRIGQVRMKVEGSVRRLPWKTCHRSLMS